MLARSVATLIAAAALTAFLVCSAPTGTAGLAWGGAPPADCGPVGYPAAYGIWCPGRIHLVVPRDSLRALARHYLGSGDLWPEIRILGRGTLQPCTPSAARPAEILPGQILLIPPKASLGQDRQLPWCEPRHPPSATPTPTIKPGSATPSSATSAPGAPPFPLAPSRPSFWVLIGSAAGAAIAAAALLARTARRRRRLGHASRPNFQRGRSGRPWPLTSSLRRYRRRLQSAGSRSSLETVGPAGLYDPDDTKARGQVRGGTVSYAAPPAARCWSPTLGMGTLSTALPPGQIPLGIRQRQEIAVDISSLGGLGLSGPGATAATRAIAATLISLAHPTPARLPGRVIIPADAGLLPRPATDGSHFVPVLSVPGTLAEALEEAETLSAHHARPAQPLQDEEQPPSPTPAAGIIALIAVPDRASARRLHRLTSSIGGPSITVIVLGEWPYGASCHVAADGTITAVNRAGQDLAGTRLFQLQPADLTAVVNPASIPDFSMASRDLQAARVQTPPDRRARHAAPALRATRGRPDTAATPTGRHRAPHRDTNLAATSAHRGAPRPAHVGGTLLTATESRADTAAMGDGTGSALLLEDMASLALEGPGADDAARAITVSFLARHTADSTQVIVAADDWAALFPGDAGKQTAIPGLTLAPTPEEALNLLETELLRRRRLLDDLSPEQPDDGNVWDGETPPDILIIALSAYPASRLTAILGLGRRLGITAITAFPLTGSTRCTIAGNGQVTTTSGPASSHLSGTMLPLLTSVAAIPALSALASNGSPDTVPPSAPGHSTHPPPPDPGRPSPPVYLSILGPPSVYASGQPVTKGLRSKAFELLTYLAVHHTGATIAELLNDLWPDIPEKRAATIAHTVITNIRQTLRAAVPDAADADFLKHRRGRYHIDTKLIATDLWRFQTDLALAARAASDEGRANALNDAASLWQGDLADGYDAEWLESWRENLRRDAADVLCQLAALYDDTGPQQALQYLERAAAIDRYQEGIYQRIIRLQGAMGRPEAARRTYHLLASRLAEIDAEPGHAANLILDGVLSPAEPGTDGVESADR
jgi:DNA-binding SARP family transcriptional activator